MKQNLFKNTLTIGIAACAFGVLSACTSLGSSEEEVVVSETTVSKTTPTAPKAVCTSENDVNCIVTYEEPDLNLSQAYAGYAMSTNASYQSGSAPISLSAPNTIAGTSVKDRARQKELAQQQADLALQPVLSADLLCAGADCDQALFKTEIEKTIQTTVLESQPVPVTVNGQTVMAVPAGQAAQPAQQAQQAQQTQQAQQAQQAQQTQPAQPAQPPVLSLKERIAYGEEVHDWDAPAGETLRTLLMQWGEQSGWTVVWKLDRDYNLEAGVVFRGKFTEVAAAFIRSFARATPAPIGTFYKGNRVLVINTQENDNAE